MNSKDFAIGILSITATILFVGLLLVNVAPPPAAYAFGQNATGGDYLVTTAQLDDATELIYILDAAAQRMNVYGFNATQNKIELVRPVDVRWRPPGGNDRDRDRER